MVPTNAHESLQWQMTNAHQTFKNGLDSILGHLNAPPLHDLPNFLGYCQAFGQSICEHHDGEEAVIFPFLNQKLDFSSEAEAHKVIHTKLDQLVDYISECQKDKSKFQAGQMKAMVEDLREPLYAHLDEEVEHLNAEKLKVFSAKEIVAMEEEHLTWIKAHADPTVVMPFVMGHVAPDVKPTWPPLPWFLRRVMIPYVFAMKHRGYWKYSPYAMF